MPLENICDKCLRTCKTNCCSCINYFNPKRRMLDWRCVICNRKVIKLHKLCYKCNAWKTLIDQIAGRHLSLLSNFRSVIRFRKLKEAEE